MQFTPQENSLKPATSLLPFTGSTSEITDTLFRTSVLKWEASWLSPQPFLKSLTAILVVICFASQSVNYHGRFYLQGGFYLYITVFIESLLALNLLVL